MVPHRCTDSRHSNEPSYKTASSRLLTQIAAQVMWPYQFERYCLHCLPKGFYLIRTERKGGIVLPQVIIILLCVSCVPFLSLSPLPTLLGNGDRCLLLTHSTRPQQENGQRVLNSRDKLLLYTCNKKCLFLIVSI